MSNTTIEIDYLTKTVDNLKSYYRSRFKMENACLYRYHNQDELGKDNYPDILDVIDDRIDECEVQIDRYKNNAINLVRSKSSYLYSATNEINACKKHIEEWTEIRKKIEEDDAEFYVFDSTVRVPFDAQIVRIVKITDMPAYKFVKTENSGQFVLSDEHYDGIRVSSVVGDLVKKDYLYTDYYTDNPSGCLMTSVDLKCIKESYRYTENAVQDYMDMSDIGFIKCKNCGTIFGIDVPERRWYLNHGFSLPKICPDCRIKRKAEKYSDLLYFT